jgi:DNA repair protein RecN (Recombination protein N)
MLIALRIENFAIVSSLELEFKPGMTAFTGETGAGKSIMIDALMLALGGRGDVSVIRKGEDKCDITASFLVAKESPALAWLHEYDVEHEAGEVLLRRVLFAEGRSKSYINGQPFPIQKLKELSEMLVDIHGQHQHQTLLNHQTHRDQLDHYAAHDVQLEGVRRLYRECTNLQQQLDALQQLEPSAERMALLQYQIEELANLDLKEGEWQALHQEHAVLHHARDYLEHCGRIVGLLTDDEAFNLTQAIHQVVHSLSVLPQDLPAIRNATEMMNQALIQCEEAKDEISGFHQQIQLDPERLQDVELRMSVLHQLARKYQVEPDELTNKWQSLTQELKQLQQVDSEQHHLQDAYQCLKRQYEEIALVLRDSRQQHASKMASEMTQHIQQLGMPKGYIEVRMSALDKMHPHGLDKVEYYVCSNPGMTPDILSKIASGGELSRISLAIQMITAQRGTTPTLLFDEVDVGIGGATAALVGQRLRQLGERLQIFCVTHQPQVASSAHQHYLVEKQMSDSATFSQVRLLHGGDKVNEIARMLGGLTITEQTRKHACELLGLADAI